MEKSCCRRSGHEAARRAVSRHSVRGSDDDDAGPQLLEYNVRFGDPEAEVIIPRFRGDLLGWLSPPPQARCRWSRRHSPPITRWRWSWRRKDIPERRSEATKSAAWTRAAAVEASRFFTPEQSAASDEHRRRWRPRACHDRSGVRTRPARATKPTPPSTPLIGRTDFTAATSARARSQRRSPKRAAQRTRRPRTTPARMNSAPETTLRPGRCTCSDANRALAASDSQMIVENLAGVASLRSTSPRARFSAAPRRRRSKLRVAPGKRRQAENVPLHTPQRRRLQSIGASAFSILRAYSTPIVLCGENASRSSTSASQLSPNVLAASSASRAVNSPAVSEGVDAACAIRRRSGPCPGPLPSA